MLVGATLAGHPVRIALDTGATASSISESLVHRTGARSLGSLSVNTADGRFRRPWGRPSFQFSGGEFAPRRVLFMPDALQGHVDAVFGAAELKRFELRFSTGELLHPLDRIAARAMRTDNTTLPIIIFEFGDVRMRLLLDSGADASSISESKAQALSSRTGVRSLSYDTAEGPQLRAIRLPRIHSGSVEFTEPLFRVRSNQPPLMSRSGEIDGLLGTDFMRAFDWSFSLPERLISVNRSGSSNQQWIGMGVDFRSDSEAPGRVLGLARNGGAMQAGIRLGDRLLTLNGVAADDEIGLQRIGSCACRENILVTLERESREVATTVMAAPLI